MRRPARALLLTLVMMWLTGCTAMMVGGGNGGGYQPPQDECEEGDAGCRSR